MPAPEGAQRLLEPRPARYSARSLVHELCGAGPRAVRGCQPRPRRAALSPTSDGMSFGLRNAGSTGDPSLRIETGEAARGLGDVADASALPGRADIVSGRGPDARSLAAAATSRAWQKSRTASVLPSMICWASPETIAATDRVILPITKFGRRRGDSARYRIKLLAGVPCAWRTKRTAMCAAAFAMP